MRLLATLVLFAMLGSTANAQSKASIKYAMYVCRGTLGSAQLAGGRAQVYGEPGVNPSIGPIDAAGNQRITLTDQYSHRTAVVLANPGRHKLVIKRMQRHGALLCVLPD